MSDNTSSPVGEGAKLAAPKALVLGLQHMFAMFGATVTVPLITGLDIGTTLLMAGAGTLLFHLITGGKVPAFLGSSFAFLGGYAAVAPRLADGAPNAEMLPYACLGVACSGLVYLVLAGAIKAFGVKRVMRCFPPIVTGPIIIAIGLGLAPVAVGSCKGNWTLALVALVVIGICNIWGKGMIKIVPILIGLAVSYVVACFMKVPLLDDAGVQVVEDGVAQCKPLIDFAAVKSADWIGSPVQKAQTILGVDFANGAQIWSAIIAIVPIALATIMEHIGDISAISSTVGKDFIKDPTARSRATASPRPSPLSSAARRTRPTARTRASWRFRASSTRSLSASRRSSRSCSRSARSSRRSSRRSPARSWAASRSSSTA